MKGLTVKDFFGYAAMVLASVIVLLFLGLHSLSFFEFTFPESQSFYAYLGFGLTSGGVVLYLVMLLTISKTSIKKFTAISMLIVSVFGEIATAAFGMRVEAWRTSGFSLTQEDLDLMILAVGILGFLHGVALIAHFAGDAIIAAFLDDDKDGIPNAFDKDYKKPNQGFRPFPAQTPDFATLQRQIDELKAENARLKDANPPKGQEAKQ